jgi:GNAT superfamily N-acetyltransferase
VNISDQDPAELLAAYDRDLRGEMETAGAVRVDRLGPLWIARYPAGRGFIAYRDLEGASAAEVDRLVGSARDLLRDDPEVVQFEWKTRGHDDIPGLTDALIRHGFVPGDVESIMIGRAEALAVDVALPDGVTLRRVTSDADLRAAVVMQNRVFDEPHMDDYADELISKQAAGIDFELWVAEADGEIVSAGQLVPVPGTRFAGIWGGATREDWRHRGIYRAILAVRARAALDRGIEWINSDSTEFSRPILEQNGFVRVSTTTPYEWRKEGHGA